MEGVRKGLWFRRLKVGLTYRCNAACTHCAVADAIQKGVTTLTFDELERIAIDARMVGVRRIILFGGEPTIHRHLFDLIRLFAAHIPLVVMDTNALRIDDDFARRLAEAGLGRAQVSVHGPDRETHGRLFGRDTFDHVVDAVRSLRHHGIDVHFSSVTTRQLIHDDQVQTLVELGRRLDVQGIRFLYPKVCGEWAGSEQILLTKDDQNDLSRYVDGDFAYLEGEYNTEYSCGAVHRGFYYISPYGELQPCCYVAIDVGRTREEPLVNAARRATRDIPWIAPGEIFKDGVCMMARTQALRLFTESQDPLVLARNDNYLDLGEAPEEGDIEAGAACPARSVDAVLADADRILESYGHIYISGGNIVHHPAFDRLIDRLESRAAGVTLVCDTQVFVTPRGQEILDRLDLMRVVTPLGSDTADEAIDGLWRGVDVLRGRLVPVEFVIIDGDRERDARLIERLVAMGVEQVSAVASEGADGSVGARHARGLLPWLPEAGPSTLLAFRSRTPETLRLAEPGVERDDLSVESFQRLEDHVAPLLEDGAAPTTLHLRTDGEGLLLGLDALERALPKLAAAGHRLTLRRVGSEDAEREELGTYNQFLKAGPLQDAVRRLIALADAWPENFEHRGFGPVLFRPWMTTQEVQAELDRILSDEAEPFQELGEYLLDVVRVNPARQDLVAEALREPFLALAILGDSDPPAIDAPQKLHAEPAPGDWDAVPMPTLRRPWHFLHKATARAHKLILAATARLREQDSYGAASSGDDDFTLMAGIVDRLEGDARSLTHIFTTLLSNSPTLMETDDLAASLEAIFGLASDDPEDDLTSTERVLYRRRDGVAAVVTRLAALAGYGLDGWEISEPVLEGAEGRRCVAVTLEGPERRLELRVLPGDSPERGVVETEHARVAHGPETPIEDERHMRFLDALCRVMDGYIATPESEELGDTKDAADDAALAEALARCVSPETQRDGGDSPPEDAGSVGPNATLLVSNAPLLRRVLERLADAPRSPLPGFRLTAFEPRAEGSSATIEVALERDAERIVLTILPSDAPHRGFVRGRSVKMTFAPETTHSPDALRRELGALCRIFDHYLSRGATPTAPGGRA